jgi:osmotically inducible lipoprotein OsmE
MVVVSVCALLSGCALVDRHSQLTIEMLLDDEGYDVDVTSNPVDITDESCGDDVECVEAYSTSEADYYRFASRDEASEFASTLTDGFVVHYIVMDFEGKDDALVDRQRAAMERLAATWQDYEGTFPTR